MLHYCLLKLGNVNVIVVKLQSITKVRLHVLTGLNATSLHYWNINVILHNFKYYLHLNDFAFGRFLG